jgi:ABC-type lipoprotein release transport system permease subunit
VAVHLTAQLSVAVIAVTVGLCLGSALIAGAFGARRAARFQPADAFAQLT